MKKSILMRGCACALAMTMAFSLTGCGKSLIGSITGQEPTGKTEDGNTSANNAATGDKNDGGSGSAATVDPNGHYFKVDYIKDVPNLKNVGFNMFRGDSFIYMTYDDEYVNSYVCSYNLVTGESKELYALEGNNDYSDPLAVHSYCNCFDVDEAGNVYMVLNSNHADAEGVDLDFTDKTRDDVLQWIIDNWGYKDVTAAEDGIKYYEEAEEFKDADGNVDYNKIYTQFTVWNLPTISETNVIAMGTDGTEKFNIKLDLAQNENGGSYCNNMAVDDDGNIYLAINEYNYSDEDNYDKYYALVFDKDGNKKGQLDSEENFYEFMKMDGKIGISKWDDNGAYNFCPIDLTTMSFGEPTALGTNYMSNGPMLDADTILYNEGGSLVKRNIKTDESEVITPWINCDISSNAVNSIGVLSDGRIAVYINQWTKGDSLSELAILNEIPASEVVPKTELKLACQYLDSDIESNVLEFNRHSNDYRITVDTFNYEWKEDDGEDGWEKALNDFYAKLVTDKTIDIICFNNSDAYADVLNMASKGLLIDMAPILDAEGTLPTDKIIPGIKNGLTIDGKLVGVPGNVTYETVMGKARDVGDKPGWTVDDMLNLLKSKPEGAELFNGMTRREALMTCINLGYMDYIDTANRTCNFNNGDFVKVLELANIFPEEIDWDAYYNENGYDSEYSRIRSGEVLLYKTYLYDFETYKQLKTVYGEDVTLIGFPSSNTNGALVNLNNIVTITRNCEAPDKAWEAIAPSFGRVYNDDGTVVDDWSYSWGFPTRTDDFDAFCKRALDPDLGGYGGDVWIDDMTTIEGEPLTQADIDAVKDVINNATGISGAISNSVFAIIEEEAGAYFSGQKSAEDVAAIIQSRVQVYLSETE